MRQRTGISITKFQLLREICFALYLKHGLTIDRDGFKKLHRCVWSDLYDLANVIRYYDLKHFTFDINTLGVFVEEVQNVPSS